MDIKVIKTEDNINFINPVTTNLSDLIQCNEICGQYILCEYLDVIEGTVVVYAYSRSLKRLDAYIQKSNTGQKYYTAKIPDNESIDSLEGVC